jgi:hypothetical protein
MKSPTVTCAGRRAGDAEGDDAGDEPSSSEESQHPTTRSKSLPPASSVVRGHRTAQRGADEIAHSHLRRPTSRGRRGGRRRRRALVIRGVLRQGPEPRAEGAGSTLLQPRKRRRGGRRRAGRHRRRLNLQPRRSAVFSRTALQLDCPSLRALTALYLIYNPKLVVYIRPHRNVLQVQVEQAGQNN